MKKLILLGDSIRIGYAAYVREKLAGAAEVLFPEENCRFAQYLYRYLSDWQQEGGWGSDADVVHWNAGLWDVIHLGDDLPVTIPEQYAVTIGQIARRIRALFPGAVSVFAASTPIVEAGYGPCFYRRNAEIERYNAAAMEVVTREGALFDDLYAVMKDAPESARSDMTHFNTPDGTERIGNAVLRCVCPLLNIEPPTGTAL